MLEMLMRKRNSGKMGPGPKTLLFGTEQAGYFGRMTQAELFTPTEVFTGVGIASTGARNDATLLWCKFYYRGEIVYIPTRPISTDTVLFNWKELYQLGVVYGVDGPGTWPDTSGNVNQNKRISKVLEGATATFKMRLPSASETLDPIDQAAGNASRTGELSELMTKVVAKGFVGAATGEWDNLVGLNFDKVNNCFVKNSGWTPSTLGAPYAVIGPTPGAYSYNGTSKAGKTPGVLWTPVLAYIPN